MVGYRINHLGTDLKSSRITKDEDDIIKIDKNYLIVPLTFKRILGVICHNPKSIIRGTTYKCYR